MPDVQGSLPAADKLRIWRKWATDAGGKPEEAEAKDDSPDWILVSEALAKLKQFKNRKAIEKFARDNPDKLHLRPHPTHSQRRQAYAADVLRLEKTWMMRYSTIGPTGCR